VKFRSLAVLGSLIVAGLVGGTAGAHAEDLPDTTAPNGTYVLARSSAYLVTTNVTGVSVASAKVQLRQTALDDPTASRSVEAGDGRAATQWRTGTVFTLSYSEPGRYLPVVTLADKAGNSRRVTLPAVVVLQDDARPKVKVKVPPRSTKASSWRVVRGTASDVGSGIASVYVFVMQREGDRWWGYDFRTKRWLRITDPAAEGKRFKSQPRAASPVVKANGTWVTPPLKGLKKRMTYIEFGGRDLAGNNARTRYVERRLR
jgi:hypothetical protein